MGHCDKQPSEVEQRTRESEMNDVITAASTLVCVLYDSSHILIYDNKDLHDVVDALAEVVVEVLITRGRESEHWGAETRRVSVSYINMRMLFLDQSLPRFRASSIQAS